MDSPGRGPRIWLRAAVFLLPIVVFAALLSLQLSRPIEAIGVATNVPQSATAPGTPPNIPWPSKGSAAVAVEGIGLVASNKGNTRQPIASVTKVMTAWVVLKDHPLAEGQKGPTVQITSRDVASYQKMETEDQSVVPVQAGKDLTEYELLQGLLIASGNNFAEILASWDAGSVRAFVDRMNAEAAGLGMQNTKYADASGFSSGSVSTAEDLTLLAAAAMQNPVFAQVVGQAQATLPAAGVVYNTDSIIGQDNIVGVKTGWTEDAGGCFLFASNWQLNGQTVKVYGAVLGQDVLLDAFNASRSLSKTVGPAVQQARILRSGTEIGKYSSAWGGKAPLVLNGDVDAFVWPGMKYTMSVEIQSPKAPVTKDAEVGAVTVQIGSQQHRVPVKTTGGIQTPGLFWRLKRLP